MELTGDSALIHQPSRLAIMGLLWKHRDVSYTEARNTLGLTDGNLATHVRRLEDAGLVVARRVLRGRDGFELRFAITQAGRRAFSEYLGQLQEFVRATQPS